MDISVVIPLYNEAESLPELAAWIERVMTDHDFTYEVIFVDDGSTDDSWKVIRDLTKKNPALHGISFRRNYGKSPALNTGFKAAQGDVVITMDADLQDSPDEIPELYRMVMTDGYDLVSGWKRKRYDPLSKTIPTKLFNATARKVSGIKNLVEVGRQAPGTSLEEAADMAEQLIKANFIPSPMAIISELIMAAIVSGSILSILISSFFALRHKSARHRRERGME